MATFSVLILTAPPPGFSSEANGAFAKIDGREALLRSVELFLNRDNVKQIQLAIQPAGIDESKQKFGAHLGFSGVKLLSGGPRWIDQIAAALTTISADASHVLIHDAARPAVPFSDIDAIMEEAEKHPAVTLAAPLRTSLIETDDGDAPVAYHLPTHFMHMLTPQVFSKQKFIEMATKKVEIHPSQLKIVKGSALNVRIGGASDAVLVKSMISMLPKPKMKGPASPFDEAQW